MSVTNGEDADQDTFNDAFMSRLVDTTTIGTVGLSNTSDPDSGDAVTNLQQFVNEVAAALGYTGEGDPNSMAYANNNYIVDGTSRKTALEALDAALALVASYTFGAWATHNVTNGQSATNLTGQTVDGTAYTSAIYEFEIRRGSPCTVHSTGRIAMQYFNGTWRVEVSGFEGEEEHGVTFSVSQSTTVGQLKAALDSGAGNGTIKLSRRLVPV